MAKFVLRTMQVIRMSLIMLLICCGNRLAGLLMCMPDIGEYAVDVGCVLAARLQARHVGVLHEPQGQDRAGQAVGEHHVADEQ